MVAGLRCAALAVVVLSGCSYSWDNPESAPTPGTTPSSDPATQPSNPTTDPQPISNPTPSPGAFCSGSSASFCDDFDGASLASIWDSVQTRNTSTAIIQTSLDAPSGRKVLAVANEVASNPGDAFVSQVLSGTTSTLTVRLFINKRAAGLKPVDVLRITAPQTTGTTSSLLLTLGTANESVVSQLSNGAVVDSASGGSVPTDAWTPIELVLTATEAKLTVGATPSTRTTVMPWSPKAGLTQLSVGILNVQMQGGGWSVQADNVTAD
jgi:hypothetical protein